MHLQANYKYYIFLLLILVLSIPFYILGAFFPVEGLPFGLPISFLMIFVPFILTLFYVWHKEGKKGIANVFRRILDVRQADKWALTWSFIMMPLVGLASFLTMRIFSRHLPDPIIIPYQDLPLMLILYFLGAIPEEFAWTYVLTEPLTKRWGPILSGALIGIVWAVWHIIPWSWAQSANWISGMCVLNILMRIAMVYLYMYGGKSLLTGIVFHMMINVAMSLFPNYGSHMNPWVFSLWLAIILLAMIYSINKQKGASNDEF